MDTITTTRDPWQGVDLKEAREALKVPWAGFCPHSPTPHQHAFLLLNSVQEVLYGGAAGGGKSDAVLMAALQYVDHPGYAALLLRRTFAQLSKADGLLERAAEWLLPLPTVKDGSYVNGLPTKYTFPSSATLEFGHLVKETSKYDYQGPAFQFIGFDELTQFTMSQYFYLKSRLRRRVGLNVPLRMRGASNPGGEGHDWVKRRFVDPGQPKCVFLPARLRDNPHLDREQYEETLKDLPEYERRQLLEGDWDARMPGSLFKRDHFQIVDSVPPLAKEVRRWDCAASEDEGQDPDWTAGVRAGFTDNGLFVIKHVDRFRSGPGEVERRVRQRAELDGKQVSVRIEQEPGSSGKLVAAAFVKALAGWDVRGVRSTGDKVVRAKPLAAQVEQGNVLLVNGPWVEAFLAEAEQFPNGSHDDQIDGASGALDDLTSPKLTLADLYPA